MAGFHKISSTYTIEVEQYYNWSNPLYEVYSYPLKSFTLRYGAGISFSYQQLLYTILNPN